MKTDSGTAFEVFKNGELPGNVTVVRNSRFRTRLYLTASLIILLVGAFGLWADAAWFEEYPYFHLENITVLGTDHIPPDQIINMINLPKGASILKLDLQNLHNQIRNHPWVADCKITRQIPDTLVINIEEHVPAGILALRARYLIDGSGRVLDRIGEDSIYRLPVIRGMKSNRVFETGTVIPDSRLQQALYWIEAARRHPSLQNRLEGIDIGDEGNFKLYIQGLQAPVSVGSGLEDQKLARLLIFLDRVETGSGMYEYIDLRFRNRIVLKPIFLTQRR